MQNEDENYNTPFSFKILHKDKKTKARVGQIITPHGIIDTPQFVPVGTQATVKTLAAHDLEEIGAQIIFSNTYHLHLRPGEDTILKLGGLNKFMNWNGITITDSGGFQVFSLGKGTRGEALVKITDEKVTFRSHLDNSKHVFTPEKSIEIQHKLGADFIVAFDQCPPYPSTLIETQKSVERTHAWLSRCIDYHKTYGKNNQSLVGVIQGGVFEPLRRESALFVAKQNLDLIAIGGVAVGESKKEMQKVLDFTLPFLPEEKPKHLLGVGEIDDIFHIVSCGIDAFDCVIPTRFGRYGLVFVSPPEGNIRNKFLLNLNKQIYKTDSLPIDANCSCKVCKNYTRGYLHHLFKAEELLAYRLASYHNVYFLIKLLEKIRASILEDRFEDLKSLWLQ